MRRGSIAATVVAVLTLFIVTGCGGGSGTPYLSGFGLGNSRILAVGDALELRMPLREDGNRAWRVTNYDSLYLSIDRRPAVVTENGKSELVVRVRAKTPGETTIEVTELVPRSEGRAPKVKDLKVRIIQ